MLEKYPVSAASVDQGIAYIVLTEAIRKELAVMIQYEVFEVHTDTNHFPKDEGWQFAKLIWIFAVKHD